MRSKDDDLGYHNITYDLGYNFHFCESIFQNTLFTKDFFYEMQSLHFNVFDKVVVAFIGGHPYRNTPIYWLLKKNGYYLSKMYKAYDDPTWILRGHWS